MPKAYWIAIYRSISKPDAVAEYAKLASPAIAASGGRFIARGVPAKVYENGFNQRTVIIEFDSLAQAVAAHETPAYKAALKVLGDGADREIRIIEGTSVGALMVSSPTALGRHGWRNVSCGRRNARGSLDGRDKPNHDKLVRIK